jgi:hypothetical protein
MQWCKQILTAVALAAATAGAGAVALPPGGQNADAPRMLADGGAVASRDDQLKAAFVYNFVQLTEWPDESFEAADAPIVIAVLNGDGMAAAIDAVVAGRQIGRRSVVIRRCKTADGAGRCHALVAPGEQDRPRDVVAAVADRPVLLIGEGDYFLPAGGTIRFFTDDKKMRFEVNQAAAARAGVRISSKLLRLAKIYK